MHVNACTHFSPAMISNCMISLHPFIRWLVVEADTHIDTYRIISCVSQGASGSTVSVDTQQLSLMFNSPSAVGLNKATQSLYVCLKYEKVANRM